MNTEHFIARRILSGKGSDLRFSRPIIRIAIAGISLGMIVVIARICIVTGFQKEIRAKVVGFGSHIQISKYDNNESYEPSPIDRQQDFMERLSQTTGIQHIQAYATKAAIIKVNQESEGIVLKGVGSDFDPTFFASCLQEGLIPKFSETTPNKGIVISRILASRLKLQVHDTIPLFFIQNQKQRAKKFVVEGIYATGMSGQFDDVMVIADLAYVQEMNGWDSTQVGGFEITINDFNRLDELTSVVNEEIGFDLRAYSVRQVYQTIFSWLDAQDINAYGLVVLIIVVCCINMISALLILILERTNMIGLLKAMGARNWSIQKIFLYNAFYLVGTGLLVGNIVGIGFCWLQKTYGLIKLDPESYFLSQVPIHLDWTILGLVNAGALIFCMLMLLIPSLLVTRITPVRALRFR